MAETSTAGNPFEPRSGAVARLARRLNCTEGQVYSTAIGVLALWAVSANALPNVVWDGADAERSIPTAAAPESAPHDAGVPDPESAGAAPEPQLYGLGGAPNVDVVTTGSGSRPATETSSPDAVDAHDTAGDSSTPGPVRVVDGGYASATAGTPLATFGVPEGSVAVAQRAGQQDKITYLRLSGTGTPLVLPVDGDGTSTLDAMAALQLCAVTDRDWKVGRGDVTPADAPKYDCSVPVPGVRSSAGDTWTFDVRHLDFGRGSGVALVPAPDASPEFQIVFRLASSSGDGSGADG